MKWLMESRDRFASCSGKSVMKPITPFVITSFTNPSGGVVFRVSGWLDGKRIRKNFSTRAET
jgi:hypothetical protein